MKNSEILEGAVEVIETHGWTQGTAGNVNEGFCLSGAMVHGIRSKGESAARLIPTALLGPIMPPRYRHSISLYNDGYLKNRQEAVDILMTGAKYWRDRGE